MPRFFVNGNQISNNNISIIGDDVNHIKNVLRMKIGDSIDICNADDSQSYETEIININNDEVLCSISKKIESKAESVVRVTIYQGLPKADKMELIIQKCVELGVYQITPVEMKRCIVKLDGKDKLKKTERWQKISEVAAKQCGRDIIPKINEPMAISKIISDFKNYDAIIVCYENEECTKLKDVIERVKTEKSDNINIAIVIGPEGGIDKNEVDFLIENGANSVSLGKRILRTETVGFSVLSIIMYEFDNV